MYRGTHALIVKITQKSFPDGDKDRHTDQLSDEEERDSGNTLDEQNEIMSSCNIR